MNTPITLKVRPKVFAKLDAMKRMYFFMYQKDVTWDEFLEDIVNRFLPFYVLEMYVKMRGKLPDTMEEFSKGLSYVEGLLEGIGLSTEQIVNELSEIAKTLPKSKTNKNPMYT